VRLGAPLYLRGVIDPPSYSDPRNVFVTGEMTIPELHERMRGQPGCSLSSLKHRCADEKWHAARAKYKRDIKRGVDPVSAAAGAVLLQASAKGATDPEVSAKVAEKVAEKLAEKLAPEMEKLAPEMAAAAARRLKQSALLADIEESGAASAYALEVWANKLLSASRIKQIEEDGEVVVLVEGQAVQMVNAASRFHAQAMMTLRLLKGELTLDAQAELQRRKLEAEALLAENKASGKIAEGPGVFLLPTDPDFVTKERERLVQVWGFDRDGDHSAPAGAKTEDGSGQPH